MKYIYIITCGAKHIKVGVAKNINKRIEALQVGAPLKLQLFDKFKVESTELAYRYEALIHQRLVVFATHGEWFRIKASDAAAIVTAVIGGPPKNKDAELEMEAARQFPPRMRLLICPHCKHQANTILDNKTIWAKRFRCSGCNISIEGRRFFIRRVA